MDVTVTQSWTFTGSDKREMVFLRTISTEYQSHMYTIMTVTKTNVTIS